MPREERRRGLFDGATLTRLVDGHASGRFDHAQELWQLLVMEGFLAGAAGAAAMPDMAGALEAEA